MTDTATAPAESAATKAAHDAWVDASVAAGDPTLTTAERFALMEREPLLLKAYQALRDADRIAEALAEWTAAKQAVKVAYSDRELLAAIAEESRTYAVYTSLIANR
jgi:hypothetical protein